MAIRPLDAALKTSLLNEEEFVYAHLVKFEKGIKTTTGESGKGPNSYAYITDGSFDMVFNDGSVDAEGNANGPQTYIANKLLAVGSISEKTHASASSLTLNIAANALNTTLATNITNTTSTITAPVDLVEAGFSEGDKIQLVFGNTSEENHNDYFRIDSFTNDNKTAVVTASGTALISSASLRAVTIRFASEEVIGPLQAKDDPGYATYINRDVFIYKAHIDPNTGAIIGAPYLLFKGIISSSKLTDDRKTGTKVSWSCTSHWGDFVRINGRITADTHHRALTGSGATDVAALKRPEYQADLGFLHSEQAINLMSIYQVKETRQKVKSKKKFFGLSTKVKVSEYEVDVDREVDLRFNLEAKHLPVVYGVQRISSIPVFVDSLKTDSKKVYAAYALCEGPIASLLDIYFDDVSSICIDGKDFETRSTQNENNTIDVLCTGRADRGDTLTGVTVNGNTVVDYGLGSNIYGNGTWDIFGSYNPEVWAAISTGYTIDPTFTTGTSSGASSTVGTVHEKGNTFVTPIDARLVFHAGKSNQKADNMLANIALANNFKVQSDYYTGTADYWGPNHQLLDTAYVTAEYTIGEGETTIPTLGFTVRGKILECYNYDYSYTPDVTRVSDSISNFKIGSAVEIRRSSTNVKLDDAVIADVYEFVDENGDIETRVRFKEEPDLTYGSLGQDTETAFYINPVGNTALKWYMCSYDHVFNFGSVAEQLSEEIVSASPGTTSGSSATIASSSSTAVAAGLPYTSSIAFVPVIDFSFLNGLTEEILAEIAAFSASGYTYTSPTVGTIDNVGEATDLNATEVTVVIIKDAIKLSATASPNNDAYNDLIVEVSRTNTTTGDVYVQRRKIIDYDGASKIATVDKDWDALYIPNTGDTFRILPLGDRRVSINPAMQTLDYITNPLYGRDLDIERDLYLPSFLASARTCDTRSDVTVQFGTSQSMSVGEEYRYPATGDVQFQGTIKSIETLNGYKQVVFTNVIGKLGYKWHDWKSYPTGQLVWNAYYGSNGAYQGTILVLGSGGTMAAPTVNTVSQVILRKVGTTTDITVDTTVGSAADGNILVRAFSGTYGQQYTSGYSLYDSDDVKYWRYVGWDSQDQRQVTRHQTNMVIQTSAPIFDNINSMLSHFNGILRHSNGKYELSVAAASSTFDEAELITEDDVIGAINVEDAGQKGTYNTISTTVADPQMMFGERSVTFFNSEYLKQDKNIPKKGDIKTPFITNYFNSRINAKQYLNQSRYGLSINFTLGPRGALLLAGELIKITNDRFGWDEKLFRISNLTLKDNCLVQVTAEEHNDDAYLIEHIQEAYNRPSEASTANIAPPSAPTALTATSNDRGGVALNWVNTASYTPATYSVQIWRNATDSFSGSKLIATVKGDTYVDPIIAEGRTNKYYWIRYSVNAPQQRSNQTSAKEIFSNYHPLATAMGVLGIADSTVDGININFTNESTTVSTLENDTLDYTDTDVSISVYIGSTLINYDGTAPYSTPSFRVSSFPGSGITVPTAANTATVWTQGDITEMTVDKGKIDYVVTVKNTLGDEASYNRTQNVAKLFRGTDGVVGTDGDRGPGSWWIGVTSLPTTAAQAATAWDSGSGNQPATEIADDQAWFYTGTKSDPTGQSVWIFDGNDWVEQAQVIDGDLIVSGTITADAIAANTITANEIEAGSITADEIAAGTITATEISSEAITAEKIQAGAITTAKLDSEVITSDKIAANAITAEKINVNAITADKVAADAITAEKINATDLSSINANLGNITAGTMKSNVTDPIPDANAAPEGLENGAFIDLNVGKFVFGSANEYILWDGTNLKISGGTITGSTFDGTAGVIIQEDGTEEAATATTLNFTTGINVAVTDNTATISVDAPDDFVNSLSWASGTGILTVGRSQSADLTVDLDGRYLTSYEDNYVDSVAFNDTSGVLTLGRTGTLGDLTVDLDGRYLTSFTDTNDYVDSVAFNTGNGILTLGRTGVLADLTVDLDGRYSTTDTNTTYTIGSSTSGDDVRINLTGSDTTTDYVTLTAGANVSISQTGDVITIASADSDSVLSNEDVQDIVGAMVSSNTETGITVEYNDATGKLNFNATGTTYGLTAVDSTDDALIRLSDGTTNADVKLVAGSNVTIGVVGNDITINAGDTDTVLTTEQVQDIVGAMFAGNTETNISVTYQDADGTIDLVSTDTWRPIHDTPVDGSTTTSISSNWAFDNVKKAVPANAVFTDTTYSVGDGGLTQKNFTTTLKTKLDGIATNANNYSLPTNNVTNATVSGQVLTLTRQGTTSTTFTNTDTNNYATSFSWASTTGVLTLNRSGLSAITIDLDGRYSTTDTNTTYTIGAVDSGANAILRLTAGGSGTGTDDVTFVAGSNITLTPNTTNSTITIDSTDTNTDTTNFNVRANTSTSTNISAGETLSFTGGGATSVARSGNIFTISSTDTNTDTTNFNIKANSGAAENISAGETITLQQAGATSISRSGNVFTISSTDTNTNTTYTAGSGLSLTGTEFKVTNNSTTFENIKAAYAEIDTILAQNIDTDVLNANSVIARTVQVFPSGGTAPTISGTTLAGTGAILKSDGDFYIGNAAQNKYMFWDQSAGSMTVRGTINADDIQGDVNIVRAFAVPDTTVASTTAWTQLGGEIELEASGAPGGHTPQAIISGYLTHTSNIDHRLRIQMKTDSSGGSLSVGVPITTSSDKYGTYVYFSGNQTSVITAGLQLTQSITGATLNISYSYYDTTNNRTVVNGYGLGTFNTINTCSVAFAANVYTTVGLIILGQTGVTTSEKNFTLQGFFGVPTTGNVTMKLELQKASTSGNATVQSTSGVLMGLR